MGDIGYFATPQEAAYAFDCEVRRHGLDGPLNEIPEPAPHQVIIESLAGEVWKPFPGTRAKYMIASHGRV